MVDAPVSGGVAGAKKGTLAVMAAGSHDLVRRVEPVLAVFGRVFEVGERPGLGQVMKLANNLMSATAMAIASEAIVMGVKAGLDPRTMVDVINAGSGRNSATQDKFPNSVIPRSFDFGFATGLMVKDVKLALDEAEAQEVPMWVGSAVRQLWQFASQSLGPGSDITELVKCLEQWAGVEVGGNR
jgi:3-hydroxyisobutyrate dehydrogenase-like beta-hydroxyacid dehydrogenase